MPWTRHSLHLNYRARRDLATAVSPRDLPRVFLRPDEDIRAEVVKDVLISYLGTNPALVHVEVSDGAVRLAGELERKSMLTRVWPAVRAVDGVIDVDGDLGYAFDDTEPLAAPERDESPLTRGTHPPIAARRLT
ncbi:MAG TPA: BON domain-containing protein [Streptosporangiaceae bacterium]|nr:BON domain-containing protein [Streptosporangiaceae bacterium]